MKDKSKKRYEKNLKKFFANFIEKISQKHGIHVLEQIWSKFDIPFRCDIIKIVKEDIL